MSHGYLYITETGYRMLQQPQLSEFPEHLSTYLPGEFDYRETYTEIYRIKLLQGDIGDYKTANIRGKLLNQFSMDEYDGYFRLSAERGSRGNVSSGVYVLDSDMDLVGVLEGLAPGENIYSARFMGERLYMVTFETVDPLFVISLENPRKPKVLGELKIPGFSNYLHPLDENHIIGFGKDADETNGLFKGMKMAMFDVSDVENPKEKFVEHIGDRGTDSELLTNHKALMHMSSMGLMAFPVTVYKNDAKGWENGRFVFQGACVYNVSIEDGFELKGQITHLGRPENDIDYNWEYSDMSFIERIIYSKGTLYTFSEDQVKATRYEDMQEISQVPLK